MSGNTFGATFYSNGRRIARMMPDIPNLTKCKNCDTILWLSDLKKLSYSKIKSSKSKCEKADDAKHLELEDLWRVLGERVESPLPIEREIFVRKRIWWKYDVYDFESIDEIDDWLQNCLSLIEILDTNETEQRCMAAELNRNLCNFSKCLELIQELPEKYNNFKERLREECEIGNPLTVVLNEKKKQIFNEDNKDDLSARLEEKIEQDEATAKNAIQFYRSFAEKCNADAQYALGKLYLDERFYDKTEAVMWVQYAAFQGHKEAIYELENLETDDDGRYDAWS